ncbi:unnamed protein product [Peronospora destructor]|uniref:Uncharacterized protein n=1 Tax=Peronospora destructor TaxID=86335 RepID=A0AAV0UFJ3_9STRA|nr:unnamed protein product [Peronospora destructor]
MLFGLAAMLVSSIIPTNLAKLVPAFEISTFDYDNLSVGNTPNEVLNALKQDGIISLANVPSYAHVRRSYLNLAAACAMSAQEADADFLLHKTLTDGTKRYTISAPSGLAANAAATTTDAVCPGYQDIYNKFSSLLELVVLSVATTLDATDFTTKDGYGRTVSSRKIMTDAVRLDHFHVYEAPSLQDRRLMSNFSGTRADTSSENDFTLELHEDHGMFIAFSTPTFYKVSNDGTKRTFELVSVGGDSYAESGLIIQTRDGRRVRPVLKPDQVTLMVGRGFEHWVDTSEKLPAVMHAMRMPEVETMATESLLRAWFGKMTLLSSYQRMVQHMDFDVHVNITADYVQQGHQSNRQLLGCAPGRHLVASADETCTFQQCLVKSNAKAPDEGCQVVCNRNHETDASVCSASCDCIASRQSATACWMLCVLDLDPKLCSHQSCSGQAKVCDSPLTPPSPASAPTPTSAPAPAPI